MALEEAPVKAKGRGKGRNSGGGFVADQARNYVRCGFKRPRDRDKNSPTWMKILSDTDWRNLQQNMYASKFEVKKKARAALRDLALIARWCDPHFVVEVMSSVPNEPGDRNSSFSLLAGVLKLVSWRLAELSGRSPDNPRTFEWQERFAGLLLCYAEDCFTRNRGIHVQVVRSAQSLLTDAESAPLKGTGRAILTAERLEKERRAHRKRRGGMDQQARA